MFVQKYKQTEPIQLTNDNRDSKFRFYKTSPPYLPNVGLLFLRLTDKIFLL